MTSSGIQLVELIFTLSAQAYLKSASYFYFFLICICWFGPLEAESQMVDHLTIETWRVFSSASFFSGFFVFILSFLDAFFFFSSYSHRVSILFSLLFSAPKLTVFRNSPAKLSHLLSSPTTLSLREQSGQSPPVWSDKKAFKPRRILIWESGLVPLCPAFNTLPLFPAVLLFLELCLLWLWASWPVDQIVFFFFYIIHTLATQKRFYNRGHVPAVLGLALVKMLSGFVNTRSHSDWWPKQLKSSPVNLLSTFNSKFQLHFSWFERIFFCCL